MFVAHVLGQQYDQEGCMPLMRSAASGAIAVMEELGGKDIVNIDYTTLHIAVSCDKL